ncbi:MAG: 2-dehydropantoate 2-reductase [Verrucomicrobia bacterium]|nr:2-dehydropantoate 2-reductase [Verrucomicrobiota bacterium]
MKIAVIGCGALGSFYGGKLCRDGQETHFLLRSDFEWVRRHGVQVKSPDGDFHFNPRCARTPEEIGVADLVLLGLKTTANAEFGKLLPPLVGPRTAVLTLQNGLGNEEALAKIFPLEQILGGLCFVCLNRVAPGVVHHLAHGKIVLGEFRRWPEPRTHDLATMFRHASIPCAVSENLERAHWEKLVWNIPFNGLGVAGAAGLEALLDSQSPIANRRSVMPTDQLLGDPRWCALVREVMLEVIAAANAKGLKIEESYADLQIERTRVMGAYRASTLVDFERGQALELESLFLEPLRQARAAGVAAPRLAALGRVLCALDPAGPGLSSPVRK